MDYYKLLRLSEGNQFHITETGLKLLQSEPNFSKEFQLIGQCDVNGNLLSDVQSANFSKPVENVPPLFDDKKVNSQNGNTTGEQPTGAGTGAKPEVEKATKGKRGSKSTGNANATGTATTGKDDDLIDNSGNSK